MKKTLIAAGLAVIAMSGMNAQVVNRAISFEKDGTVDCGPMPALDNLSSYSVQLWLNPDNWSEGATLLSRGDNFLINLGEPGKVRFIVGDKSVTASSTDLKAGDWNQVTFIVEDGKATALVNGTESGSGALNEIPSSEDYFELGGGYEGLLDEVRVWNEALNEEMKTFDYFTNNTLNHYCPMWDNLLAYYKMDQENCPYLVEYKVLETPDALYDNHGIMSSGVKRVVASNDKMPYLVNAAYTENSRFFDRIIPREQYLLSNEVIILGADCVGATGHVVPRTPNNHASAINGAIYMDSYSGRSGVLSFDGKSTMTLPAETLPTKAAYTFESWIYIDQWVPGAYLLRKENDAKTEGIAIYLGPEEGKRIIARINGNEYACMEGGALPVGEWVHFGLATGTGSSVSQSMNFYNNGKRIYCDPKSELTTGEASNGNLSQNAISYPIIIGENFKGKLDETLIWKKSLATSEVAAHMTNVQMPALNKNVTVADMNVVSGYYKYDQPDNLGHSSHSQDEWANIMRSAYEGHYPAKITLSVRGHGKDDNPGAVDEFNTIMNTPEKRKIFAADLAELSKNYDGVELDLEWVYNATGWSNYHNLSKEIIAALPEGKTFRISTHNVTYAYPKGIDGIENPAITGFTFQQYGPQKTHFSFNTFKDYVDKFLAYGYPADKILTSYSTTTSNGFINDGGTKGADIRGLRLGTLKDYEPGDQDIDKYTEGTITWSYIGPMQAYKRAKLTREKNLQGIFYWDMGNDNWEGTPAEPVMPKYHAAKYCSYGINANCDTIVNDLKVRHYGDAGVGSITEEKKEAKNIIVSPSPADNEITVSFTNGETVKGVSIYSMAGGLMLEDKANRNVKVGGLNSGIYVITAKDSKGVLYKTKFVKK